MTATTAIASSTAVVGGAVVHSETCSKNVDSEDTCPPLARACWLAVRGADHVPPQRRSVRSHGVAVQAGARLPGQRHRVARHRVLLLRHGAVRRRAELLRQGDSAGAAARAGVDRVRPRVCRAGRERPGARRVSHGRSPLPGAAPAGPRHGPGVPAHEQSHAGGADVPPGATWPAARRRACDPGG